MASENAKIYLPNLSKDLREVTTPAEVFLLGRAGVTARSMTSLKQSKDNLESWIGTFECGYGYYDQYTKGTKIEEIVIEHPIYEFV